MSTGASCELYEETPGKWFYKIQNWPYGDTPDREVFGPFGTFVEAWKHLMANHPNPGGIGIRSLPGCAHDLTHPLEIPYQGLTHGCDRCGSHITLPS